MYWNLHSDIISGEQALASVSIGYFKVVLATLHTELMQFQDSGYTAVDPTSPGLSMPYQSFTV